MARWFVAFVVLVSVVGCVGAASEPYVKYFETRHDCAKAAERFCDNLSLENLFTYNSTSHRCEWRCSQTVEETTSTLPSSKATSSTSKPQSSATTTVPKPADDHKPPLIPGEYVPTVLAVVVSCLLVVVWQAVAFLRSRQKK